MKAFTAGFVPGDTGYARLFRFAKYGYGNVPGTDLPASRQHVIRVDAGLAGNTVGVSTTVVVKPWTRSGNVPQLTFTTTSPLVDNLSLYVEDAGDYWVLLGRHNLSGDRMVAELVSPSESGFAEPIVNDPYTYVPSGTLAKPMAQATRRLPTTPTAAQWINIATIRTTANYSRYSALLALAETESIGTNSTVNLFSLGINHQSTASPVTVALFELTELPRKAFEVHYVTSTANNVGVTDLWVKTDVGFTTINLTVLSEAAYTDTVPASVQYHANPTWTSAAPSGAIRAGSSSLVESGLTFSNSWVAMSGYSATTSTGVVVSGRMARLNMNVTGGAMPDNTIIATVNSSFAPKTSLDVMALVTDVSGAHSLGRLVIFNDGTIRTVGPLAANTKVTASASWRIPNFG